MNRLIGFSPVHLDGNQVSGIDGNGSYQTSSGSSMAEYMVHMVKLQALLGDTFGLQARKNDATSELADLIESVGASKVLRQTDPLGTLLKANSVR